MQKVLAKGKFFWRTGKEFKEFIDYNSPPYDTPRGFQTIAFTFFSTCNLPGISADKNLHFLNLRIVWYYDGFPFY